MEHLMPIAVGAVAPDFTLKDENNQDVTLSDFRGEKNVLLVFYPFAFSGVCNGELCEIRDNIGDFLNDDAELLAISVDAPYAHKAWATQQGYQFRQLSDFWPHGEVARAYGVFNEDRGFALRGTFLIDREGIVRFAEMNQPGEARDQNGWRKALAAV
jgi:peroxiredoxin (alkyl hydroperoxide reductase subunit C)